MRQCIDFLQALADKNQSKIEYASMAELADARDFSCVTLVKVFYDIGGRQMNKKYRLISMMCAICGIIGGIFMIIGGFMEDAFPRPLWLVVSICMFLNAIGILLNYRYIRKQKKTDIPEEGK